MFLLTKLRQGLMEKINAPLPKGEIFSIHNVNAYSGVDMYKVK
jgi:hypothetical protein